MAGSRIIITILLLISAAPLRAGLLINEVACNTSSDWVELYLHSEHEESMEISSLYVTMYYGTNESLAAEPVTISSYNRPETPYDDRYIVVHLTEPNTSDETDRTGDTNGNGYLDLYCGNYYTSLWNSDAVVAIDSDDDPENGGIIDFIAYSNNDGSPNKTIASYAEDASEHNQWTSTDLNSFQSTSLDIGINGVDSHSTISRNSTMDTNSLNDFTITKFQTPGSKNIISDSQKGRTIFKIFKKTVLITNTASHKAGTFSVFIYEPCSIKIRVFSPAGVELYSSEMYGNQYPGVRSFAWPVSRSSYTIPTGLYICKIEASSKALRATESDIFYFIIKK